jgi:hypothetical protein
MSQQIDVSGLPPEYVRMVERLVQDLRQAAEAKPGVPVSGPDPNEPAEVWIKRFRAWVDSHPVRNIEIDDSREAIYGDRG